MKHFSLISAALLLCACAGNPPAWWNPGERYSGRVPTARTAAPQPRQSSTFVEEDITPHEENIAPVADGYEELSLAPLKDDPSYVAEPAVAAQPAASSAAAQPDPGLLPPPSVLE